MRIKLLLILLIVSLGFALNDVSKPYTFAPKDPIASSKINANYDTLYNRINQNNDSIDTKFIRFYDLNSHDSTIKYLNVDTIRSAPDIDTIKGNTRFAGSPSFGKLTADTINPSFLYFGTRPSNDSTWKLAFDNFTLYSNNTTTGFINYNTYYESGNWKYRTSKPAAMYQQTGGAHRFYVARYGASDNNVTWLGPYTFDTTGLGINKTPTAPLDVAGLAKFDSAHVSDMRVDDSLIGNKGVFSGTLTAATLNTGIGANELYAMDQNVRTTDSITALTNKATRGRFSNLYINGKEFIYKDTSFVCTLYTFSNPSGAYDSIGYIRYVKTGKLSTLIIGGFDIGFSSTSSLSIKSTAFDNFANTLTGAPQSTGCLTTQEFKLVWISIGLSCCAYADISFSAFEPITSIGQNEMVLNFTEW